MPRKKIDIEPPETTLGLAMTTSGLSYELSLLTPVVGGGVESWKPNQITPVRSASVKGHLRFWWRAMQNGDAASASLWEREKQLWGGTDSASLVKIAVYHHGKPEVQTLERNEKGIVIWDKLPDYVLFPLQGQTGRNHFELIQACSFTLSISCPPSHVEEVERCVRLWVLFGGIGARTRRGCGSLYCENIMRDYQQPEDIEQFLKGLTNNEPPALNTAPYPRLCGARFRTRVITNSDPLEAWKSFLDRYKNFRQGDNYGRNPGVGHPGRTRWPEADAIRRITGCVNRKHNPVHPSGNWFPRGAYGLPIQTEFKNEPTDPHGKFMLQPDSGKRWPSPVILKIIRLGNGQLMETCFILNAAMPDRLELCDEHRLFHHLLPNEMPLASAGKNMPVPGPILTSENPYDGLIRHLGL